MRFGDTTRRENCIELKLENVFGDEEERVENQSNFASHVTCLLRLAHESTQCPRCRRYRSINKCLCERCAPLVPGVVQKQKSVSS